MPSNQPMQQLLYVFHSLHRQTEDVSHLLGTVDLQRYIRLARSFRPTITPEAKELLVKCYKKLREDRSYVRGACGVTVRQLESLVRLSEAVARVYLDLKVRADHVMQAFDLQYNSVKRVDQANIDLEPDIGAEVGAAEPAGGEEGEQERDA